MNYADICWVQRFKHFSKAFALMKEAVELAHQRPLSELENLGLILIFEYTHELAWTICKDFLERKGVKELFGSIDTTRAAFKIGLINDEGVWMDMIASRNLTNESYLETIAARIGGAILETYFSRFGQILTKNGKCDKVSEWQKNST